MYVPYIMFIFNMKWQLKFSGIGIILFTKLTKRLVLIRLFKAYDEG